MRGAVPRQIVRYFVGSTLVLITVCTLGAALWFGGQFIDKENSRSQIVLDQISQVLSSQYSPMTEEMWTKNYEAIFLHVELAAKQLGNARFHALLFDTTKKCITESQNGVTSLDCKLPNYLADHKDIALGKNEVGHHAETSVFYYTTPLSLGHINRGYLYVELGDPYGFYHGSVWKFISKSLLPVILVLIVVWIFYLWTVRKLLLKPYLEGLLETERQIASGNLAMRVAHDIRSPVYALNVALKITKDIPPEARDLLTSATQRIQEIAEQLLSMKRNGISAKTGTHAESSSEVFLTPLIREILSEKQIQYPDDEKVQFQMDPETSVSGLIAAIDPKEFKCVLSNLIDNSVEARSSHKLVVRVQGERVGREIRISVKDNGRGIARDILPKLGQEGASFGKVRGTGLGLSEAKKSLTSWKGSLHIESTEGLGTLVTLKIPAIVDKTSYVEEVTIPKDGTVIVVDDDPSILERWKRRLSHFSVSDVLYFSSGASFEKWFSERKSSLLTFRILMDQHLANDSKDGLSFIFELGLQRQAVLVTSAHLEKDIKKRALHIGVRLLPKTLIENVLIKRG